MFKKKLFSYLILCSLAYSIKAEEVIMEGVIEAKDHPKENKAEEYNILFEVKQSAVFEDFSKNLSEETKAALQSFIKQIEVDLTRTNEFQALVKRYHDLFIQLKLDREKLIKITLLFTFDKENWLHLVKPFEIDLDILKNKFSEEQLNELKNNLSALANSLNDIMLSFLKKEEAIKLQEALKAQSFNQKIRIGLAVSL